MLTSFSGVRLLAGRGESCSDRAFCVGVLPRPAPSRLAAPVCALLSPCSQVLGPRGRAVRLCSSPAGRRTLT